MLDLELATRLGAALALGLLLGLERERKSNHELLFGGVRTFALIALLGAVSAFAHDELQLVWLAPIVFVALVTLVVVAYAVTARQGEIGLTTEISAVLVFVLGVLCGRGQIGVAAAVAIASLLLLTLKDALHRLAQRVETADVEATLKFAIISMIVLPLLPDQNFGPPPLDVVNPYRIWLMVVLIAGVNFFGYVLVKVLGREHGLGLTGLLGGLVSSTAATLSLSRRSRHEPARAAAFVVAILLSWTVMFARVIIVVGAVNRSLATMLAGALGLMAAVALTAAYLTWQRDRSHETGAVETGANPFEIGHAVRFGLLFGAVTLMARAAEVSLGTRGLYLAGALAGLTDVDAISLSMAGLAAGELASTTAAAHTILIAVVANTLVKAAMAAWVGAPALRRRLLPVTLALLLAAAAGVLLIR